MPASVTEALVRYTDAQGGGDGLFVTPVPGMNIIRSGDRTPPNGMVYKPCLCITMQGAKEVTFGEAVFDYGEMAFLLVSIETPAFGRITEASRERPYIGLTIDLDVGVLREVVDQIEDAPAASAERGIGVFAAALDEDLGDCVWRLARLFDEPGAIPILQPGIMREIGYRLLTGPHGHEVCKLVLPNSHMQRVADAIRLLRDNFTRPVRIEHLAEAARMSSSSFHEHFKALTSMTPLQYQKQLRLLEARRLMASEEFNASHAAFKVGYESPSQFSRDYARMFGNPPRRDVAELKSLAA